MERIATVSGTTNLLDILDRILDKGLVIAGDIRVSLANVELLTVRIRLLVCSVDKAEQIGMNWWKHDPNLTAAAPAPKALPSRPPNPIQVREPARGPGRRNAQPVRKRGRNAR
jgi:hypothetical protein